MNNLYTNPDIEIWAVAAGKGGVGKTAIASALAMQLWKDDNEVVAVDCDFNSPNLHMWFGIEDPQLTWNDFLSKSASLEEILTDIPNYVGMGNLPRIKMIAGSSYGMQKLTDIMAQHTKKIIKNIKSLKPKLRKKLYVIIDLGGGSDNDTLDLYNMADKKILVVQANDPSCIGSNHNFLATYMRKKTSDVLLSYEGRLITSVKAGIRKINSDIASLTSKDECTMREYKERRARLMDGYSSLERLEKFIKASQTPKDNNYSKYFLEFLEKLEKYDYAAYDTINEQIIGNFMPLIVVSRARGGERTGYAPSKNEELPFGVRKIVDDDIRIGKEVFPSEVKERTGVTCRYVGYVSERPSILRSVNVGEQHFMFSESDAVKEIKQIYYNIKKPRGWY